MPASARDWAGYRVTEAYGRFPSAFLIAFCDLVARLIRRGVLNVLTYDDFLWEDDRDYVNRYPDEWRRWNAAADPERIHLLIQHDVDVLPERTESLLGHQRTLGIPTNIMLFWRNHDRRILEQTQRAVPSCYQCDHAFLSECAKAGWVIGYHNNSYERGGFDLEAAARIFLDDIAALSRHYDLAYFSAHGGARDAQGRSNNRMTPPPGSTLRWVHNRYSPRFHGDYTDSLLLTGQKDPGEYIGAMRPGRRYRILFHPQYYWQPVRACTGTEWSARIRQDPGAYWESVEDRLLSHLAEIC